VGERTGKDSKLSYLSKHPRHEMWYNGLVKTSTDPPVPSPVKVYDPTLPGWRYPWEEWKDGQWREFGPEDLTCSLRSFATLARHQGFKVIKTRAPILRPRATKPDPPEAVFIRWPV